MRRVSIGIVVFLFTTFVGVSLAAAAWVDLGGPGGAQVDVLESSPARIALDFSLGGFERQDVAINGSIYAQISLPAAGLSLEEGLPELPVVARSVIIPDDRSMSVRVVSSQYIDLSGYDVAPSKGNLLRTVDPKDVPYTFASLYATDGWYPTQTVMAREPYILRDFRGMAVVITPFQYNPGTHTLRVYTHMTVELVDAGPGGANVLTRVTPLSRVNDAFAQVYQNHFMNYGHSELRYQPVPEVGRILVIAYDSFADAVQPYVDWKNKMGVPTTLVLKSAVGTTAVQFKTYLQSEYNSTTSPRLAFALLVGDAAQIPTPTSDGGAADPTYSKLAGGDNYPDIFVGRFSAETVAQVQTQVERTIRYESDPLYAGGDWYPKGVGIGSEFGVGDDSEYDWEHIDNIRTQLMGYGYTLIDELYGSGATSAQVSAAVNSGRTIINYCGHGSMTSWGTTGFSNNQVNQLVNDNKLPFIFSVACVNGEFDAGTCFAEAWLRATHSGVPTGAIGFYGASINQSWNPPMEAQDEANNLLATDAVRTYGSYCYTGSCSMMDHYGGGGVSMFNTWHIFGDPSLRYRTKTPEALTVNFPENIAPDATTYELDVPGVQDALCALSYQSQFLGSAFTDAGGHAVITVSGTLPQGQSIDLTVTGYNKIPFYGTVPVELPLIPSIVLDPTSFEVTLPANSWEVDTLYVSNMGEPGSVLNFDVRFSPMIPGLWLTLNPSHGSVPFGETMDIHVRFTTVGMREGDYLGQIVFNYNPSQTAYVPVTMHVTETSGVGDGSPLPSTVRLETIGENPFRTSSALRFGLPQDQPARLVVYDTGGRAVRVLAEGPASAGYHSVVWDGQDAGGRTVPTGVYFVRMETAERTLTARLLRVR